MAGKKKSNSNSGCCACMSIRLKAYILLFVCFLISALVIIFSDMIPLVTMRDLEEKQIEIDMLTMGSDLTTDILSFKDLAYTTLRDIANKVNESGSYGNLTASEPFIRNCFMKNGRWNSETYKNGYVIYGPDRTAVFSEFHLLDETTFRVNMTARPLPDKFAGQVPLSKGFLRRILRDNETWYGLADRNELIFGYVPFYVIVTVPLITPRFPYPTAWLALIMDERLSVMKTMNKLKFCAGDVPGNAVIYKGAMPKDFEMYTKDLKGMKTGYFHNFEEAGGTYRTLIHSQYGLIHEGVSSCYDPNNKIYESKRFFGTTYFAIRDMSQNNASQILTYLRVDHTLDIMNETIDFIIMAVVIPSCVFLVLLVVVVVIYVEVGVMKRLDQAKKSLRQIILERRAILEQYLKGNKTARDYYSFSKGKSKGEEDFNDLLERVAEDTGGRRDELGLLMNMSSSITKWMEHILQDKMKSLDSAKKENAFYHESLTLLSAWARRSDVRFSPSYIAVDSFFFKSPELKHKFDIFSKAINVTHILGNAVALEMFKSYCKASGNEGSLYFVLDIAWLTMMEDVLHSKSGGESSIMTDTSGSVTSAHGNITHSQIVRLVQTIFSTYIFSPDHTVDSIGLPPATLKRLMVRADPKGKVKYAPGLFKSAASEVRRYLDTDILPLFKNSAQFRALFSILYNTSQISFSASNEITIYACPIVQKSASEESKESKDEEEGEKEEDAEEEEAHESDNEEEEGDKETSGNVDTFVSRLPLQVTSIDAIEALVEEEKNFQKRNMDPSTSPVPASLGQDTSKQSLRSSASSQSNSRAKLRAVSPFAALLPGAKRKTSVAESEGSEASGEEKKDPNWMKKSFIFTSKKEKSETSETSGVSESDEDSHDDDK